MPDETHILEQVAKDLSNAQVAVGALATIVGTSAIRGLWKWFTRTYDETFLLALATHTAAIERASMLMDPPTWMDTPTKKELQRIADQLVTGANNDVRRAIAKRDWALSKKSGIGPLGIFFGSIGLIIGLLAAGATSARWSIPVGYVSAGILVVVPLSAHGFQDWWCRKRAKQIKEPAQRFTTPSGGVMTREGRCIIGDVEACIDPEHPDRALIRYTDATYTIAGPVHGRTLDQIVTTLKTDPGLGPDGNPASNSLD